MNMNKVRTYRIAICDQCCLLEGEMCHESQCVFCRRTMAEVGGHLDVLLIRPVIDGEQLDLRPAKRSRIRRHTSATAPTCLDDRTDSEDPE